MNRKVFLLMLAMVFVSTPALRAESDTDNLARTQTQLDNLLFPTLGVEQVLPRSQTRAEKELNAYLEGAGGGGGRYLWECFPQFAGFTNPPPSTSRFPTEAEQTNGVLYGWPGYGCQMPELTELIRNSIRRVDVTVLVDQRFFAAAQACLRSRGFSEDDLAQIRWYRTFLDGIWMRDYGPEILYAEDGSLQFIDLGYYSGPSVIEMNGRDCQRFPGRPNDDISPTRFAPDFSGGSAVFRPQLRTEGGNLQTDGQGTCVHMQRDVLQQNNFSRWRYTQEQLDDVYRRYFNCQNVITLESLRPDPFGTPTSTVIDHVDMIMTFLSPTKVLMGQYDPADDPVNAAILDRNAQTMADAGYDVVRIPMPKPYCTVDNPNTCIARPGEARDCGTPNTTRVWSTYANSIRVGDAMMVPIYRQFPARLRDAIMAQEDEALAIYQQELDAEFGEGAVTVVPIVSDTMVPCEGAVHCITMTY